MNIKMDIHNFKIEPAAQNLFIFYVFSPFCFIRSMSQLIKQDNIFAIENQNHSSFVNGLIAANKEQKRI